MERDIMDAEVQGGTVLEGRPNAEDWIRQLSARSATRRRPEIEEALELARTVVRQYTLPEY